MQARNLTRPLLVSVALLVAGSAMAQATDKDAATTSKQSRTKASAAKPAAATKRLDFVPEQQRQGDDDAADGTRRQRAEPRQGRLALRPFGGERRLTILTLCA